MAATARIKINSSSSDGKRNTDEEILKELQEIRKSMAKDYSTKSSGMFGLGGLGGKAGVAATVAAAITATLIALGIKSDKDEVGGTYNKIQEKVRFQEGLYGFGEGGVGVNVGYEERIDPETGVRQILEVESATGKILDTLTEREAIERGILDNAGNMKDIYQTENSVYDQIVANEKRRGDAVYLSTERAIELGLIEDEEARLRELINELLRKKARSLGSSMREAGAPIREGYEGTIIPSGTQGWALTNELQLDNQVNLIENFLAGGTLTEATSFINQG